MKLEQAAGQLEALGYPTRLAILRILVQAGAEGLPVAALRTEIGIAASSLSHHLHRMVVSGLVSQERRATSLICRANLPAMEHLLGFLAGYTEAGSALQERLCHRSK